MIKKITIFDNCKLHLNTFPWEENGCDIHAKKDVDVYVDNLISAKLKVEYNMISGGNSFNVSFNNHKVINDIFCGWGGCKDTAEADVTDILVSGVNKFDLYFYKAPFCHPGDKNMVFSAYLIISYEGSPPGQAKVINVAILQGEQIELSPMDTKKTKTVYVTALWDDSKTKILNVNLKTNWQVNVDEMSCDIYWNDNKIQSFYCGWGQCSDNKSTNVELRKGINKYKVEVYKPIWHPWSSVTTVSSILSIVYYGSKPIIKMTPPLPDWVTYVKYGALAGGCIAGGYLISKEIGKKRGGKK